MFAKLKSGITDITAYLPVKTVTELQKTSLISSHLPLKHDDGNDEPGPAPGKPGLLEPLTHLPTIKQALHPGNTCSC